MLYYTKAGLTFYKWKKKKKSHVSEFFYFNRLYNGQHVFKFPEHGSLTKMTLTPLRYTKMALRWGMKVFQPIEEEKPEEKHNDDLWPQFM